MEQKELTKDEEIKVKWMEALKNSARYTKMMDDYTASPSTEKLTKIFDYLDKALKYQAKKEQEK